MDVDGLLTTAQKREARMAIAQWVEAELNSSIQSEARDMAHKWMLSHKKELEALVAEEMKKKLPMIAKHATQYI